MDVLEILLAADEKIIEKLPEKEIEVTRLSEACGEPVIFKLRGMSYNRVAEIKAMASSTETAEEDAWRSKSGTSSSMRRNTVCRASSIRARDESETVTLTMVPISRRVSVRTEVRGTVACAAEERG